MKTFQSRGEIHIVSFGKNTLLSPWTGDAQHVGELSWVLSVLSSREEGSKAAVPLERQCAAERKFGN